MASPIAHIEFVTKNVQQASDFYNKAFGWEIQVQPEFDYWMFRIGNELGGAFLPPSSQGHIEYKEGDVLVYIGSQDIDADLAKIEGLGGKTILPKSEIPGTGWFAIFNDPTGNRLALFQAAYSA
jgi:predicted enzyme related to lactoylglutathione lyase